MRKMRANAMSTVWKRIDATVPDGEWVRRRRGGGVVGGVEDGSNVGIIR
jgi:hypothetical protein